MPPESKALSGEGGSLACVHPTKRNTEHSLERSGSAPPPRRLARAWLKARTGPQTPRQRPPGRGPARGALRFSGPVLGRAPLGAIRPRRRWEVTHAEEWKQKLTAYNLEDCLALKKVTEFLYAVSSGAGLKARPQPGSVG